MMTVIINIFQKAGQKMSSQMQEGCMWNANRLLITNHLLSYCIAFIFIEFDQETT